MKPESFKQKEEPKKSCYSCIDSTAMCPDGYYCDKHDFYIAEKESIMLCVCDDYR